jgi:hypothetical protein
VATISPGGNHTLLAKSVNIGDGSRLELGDNDLVIDYATTSPYVDLRDDVAAARIIATAAPGMTLVLADNAVWGGADWNGAPIDATTLIATLAYVGDANLDGQVTTDDYVAVDLNLGRGETDGSAQWVQGDMDGSGSVTTDDYVVVDLNLGAGTTASSAEAEPEPIPAATTVDSTAPPRKAFRPRPSE